MSNIHRSSPSSLSAVTIFLSSDAHSASSAAPFVRLEQFHSAASRDAATPAHAAYIDMVASLVARQLIVKK